MKLGYPVTNLGLGCTTAHTFRLALLERDKLIETAQHNIDCLKDTIHWNVANNLKFYRISSSLIPFASHSAMSIDWHDVFKEQLEIIGEYIRQHNIRISMHPGQFVVINSPADATYASSVRELQYHADLLDLMRLDTTHKVQIHLGGLHGDAAGSTQVFISRYNQLSQSIRNRLVIENDERLASLQDCLAIHQACGIPVLLDTLHHQVKNNGETLLKALRLAAQTWSAEDGVPLIDYSSQNFEKKTGAHALTLDVERFRSFLKSLRGIDIDIMFEIKNKEASALQAKIVAESLGLL